jgi:hypothetical protein
MSKGRVLALASMVVFVLLMVALIGADAEVEVIGLTLPVWVVALVSYLLGWAATVGTVMQRKAADQS